MLEINTQGRESTTVIYILHSFSNRFILKLSMVTMLVRKHTPIQPHWMEGNFLVFHGIVDLLKGKEDIKMKKLVRICNKIK